VVTLPVVVNGVTVTAVAPLTADTQPLPSVTVTVYDPAVETVIEAVSAPVLQRYDEPSLAVKTTLPPEQNVVDVAAVIVAVGNALTVTVTSSVSIQPLASVPVTVYVVVEEGVKATPFVTLLFQAYESAPEPESVTAVPAQTVWLAPASAVGKALTVTTVAELAADTQPLASVAITVYEPAVDAVYVAPVPTVDDPLLQEYVEPPLAVKTTLPPEQKVVGDPLALIVAVGKAAGCVIVTEAVAVQALASVTVTE
jgi:hypothetical protein